MLACSSLSGLLLRIGNILMNILRRYERRLVPHFVWFALTPSLPHCNQYLLDHYKTSIPQRDSTEYPSL